MLHYHSCLETIFSLLKACTTHEEHSKLLVSRKKQWITMHKKILILSDDPIYKT